MNRSGKGLFKDEKDFNAWIANHKRESFKMRNVQQSSLKLANQLFFSK